jgi:hypothetical protein
MNGNGSSMNVFDSSVKIERVRSLLLYFDASHAKKD